LLDVDAERVRLSAQRDEVGVQLGRTRAKLANPGFLAKAAPDIVEKETEKRDRLEKRFSEIDGQLRELDGQA